MKALGVPKDAPIVVYDNHGFKPAPRVLFMLKAFGAKDVRLLNGGLHYWKIKEYPTESGPQKNSSI